MSIWQLRPVPFKFQLSDLTLFSISIPLQSRAIRLVEKLPAKQPLSPPSVDDLTSGSQGFVIRGLPIAAQKAKIQRCGEFLCYIPQQYQHYFIDLEIGFQKYVAKFNSKTRATISRKVRKYAEYCGGSITWKTYSTPEELGEFLQLAVDLSKSTYQDRLLDAGLPDTEEFRQEVLTRARTNRVRAYILFDRNRPVSYLFCPIDDGILTYAYLGYDPEYMRHSVGTVLQWLAIEQIFNEGRFRYFDFTEGQSDHKRLFATHHRQCANVYLLKPSIRNKLVIHAHSLMNCLSNQIGELLNRLRIKAKIKRLLRFSR